MLNCKISMVVLALTLCVGTSAFAAKDKEEVKGAQSHAGKFVSASGNTFVMSSEKGKQHTHALAPDAKITCDGKVCKTSDLKSDMKIRVTTKQVAGKSVSAVEAIERQKEFETMLVGTVVTVTAKKLTMKDKEGRQHAHRLSQNSAVCCDGKTCSAIGLKAGTKIRVTTKDDGKAPATRIEALDTHKNFAEVHEENLASMDGKTLTIKARGSEEHSHTLAADTVVTRDGKICKASDLKPKTRVRVTVSERLEAVVTQIEAIHKQDDFAHLDQ